MKRIALSLILSVLAACAPQATLKEEDSAALAFLENPSYNLELQAARPIERGEVNVAGFNLVLTSTYCVTADCRPGPDGFIRLLFPDEPDANYTDTVIIKVVSGVPIKGRAVMVLQGEDSSRPANLLVK